MICSEYVFRCFDEATPRRPYDLHLNELIARLEGVAPGYDMSVAHRPIGHGVHAESIFAWATRSATGPFVALRPPTSLYLAGGAHEAVSDPRATLAEIEELSRRYLAEVREVGSPEARVGVDVVALRTSVERFALALQAATTGQPLRAPEGVSDSLKSAFDHLYRAAADFVTPGDLYKADSLFTVGHVAPS